MGSFSPFGCLLAITILTSIPLTHPAYLNPSPDISHVPIKILEVGTLYHVTDTRQTQEIFDFQDLLTLIDTTQSLLKQFYDSEAELTLTNNYTVFKRVTSELVQHICDPIYLKDNKVIDYYADTKIGRAHV